MPENFVINTEKRDDRPRHGLEVNGEVYRFKEQDDFSLEDHEAIQAFQEKATDPNATPEEFAPDAFAFVNCVLYDPIDETVLRKFDGKAWKGLLDYLVSRFV